MTSRSGVRLLVLKFFLCFSGLLFSFSILTENAFLQNALTMPTPTPNIGSTSTPRPKKKTTPKDARTVAGDSSKDVLVTSGNMSVNAVPSPVPPANSTVRGKVFYADSGRPVKRAPIMLMQEKGIGGPGNSPNALTDAEGNFVLKKVRAGTYYAMVNAPGVVSPLAFVDFARMRGGRSEEEEFEKASQGFEKIVVDGISELNVQIPARRGGAIGGRIMYDDGDPAIGVKVEILRKVDNRFLPVIPNMGMIFSMLTGGSAFQTDDRGVYRFSGLPTGEYIVKVTESASHNEGGDRPSYREFESSLFGGNSLLNIFYPDAYEPKSASIINVELGQEIAEINLTIPSRSFYQIEGKIVAAKDKSPVRARLTLRREGGEDAYSIFNEFGSRDQSVATDENGNWKFKELPKGNYKLTIEPVQGESEIRTAYTNDYSSNSNVAMSNPQRNIPPKPKLAKKVYEIKIEDRDLTETIIELGAGATIAGSIEVENNAKTPVSVSIQAVSENGDLTTLTTAGSSDRVIREAARSTEGKDFRLENIAAGKTYFYVQHLDENYYVKSVSAGGIDLLAGALDLKDGEVIENVRIVLSAEVAILKGKVLDERNEPLKNADFILVPTEPNKQKSTTFFRDVKTDEKGEFEKKLAPGEYAVVFLEPNLSTKNYVEFFKNLAAAVKDAQKVTVEGGKTENLTVRKIKK